MADLRRTFKPEFLNRVDDTIVFRNLTRENITTIARGMLRTVIERMAGMGIELTVTDEASDYLAENGYDPNYGARPLRRTIQSKLEDLLAERMLDGSVKAGDSVSATVKDGTIVIEKTAQETA